MSRRIAAALSLTAAAALASAASATAAPNPAADFGQHVASCAQEHLGQRDTPPEITCSHDGMTMTFPNFGAMVQHIQEMHG